MTNYEKWAAWREHGGKPPRPAGLPKKIPAAWWTRYKKEHPPKPAPIHVASVWDGPGLFTDQDANSARADFWKDLLGAGRWCVQQAQNGDNGAGPQDFKPVDLAAWRAAGFKAGVWGVTYSPANFAHDGAALAKRANDTGSDLCIIDAEECLKNADPRPLIAALNAFPGPKALSTYGAASGLNIFPIDYKAFLDAGYHILPQAYYQLADEYAPKRCVEHMKQVAARDGMNEAFVLSRTHMTLYTILTDPAQIRVVDGPEQVRLCREAGLGRDVSGFMPEFSPYAYEAMRPIWA